MKKIILIISIFLTGCGSVGTYSNYRSFNKEYHKTRTTECIRRPEYIGLRQEITKAEYRILPLRLQQCYIKK